jgi:hypothetical protein
MMMRWRGAISALFVVLAGCSSQSDELAEPSEASVDGSGSGGARADAGSQPRDGAGAAPDAASGGAGSAGQACVASCGARKCGTSQCGDPCGQCGVGQSCTTDGLCVSGTWQPGAGPLKSKWTDQVDPASVLPEYPRPGLVRSAWLSLNGLWEFQAGSADEAAPVGKTLAKKILVPFPIESSLSGVMQMNVVDSWYRRRFVVPPEWNGKRVLLHFGAVDWEAEAFVNGTSLGVHKGGYDAFSFDVTDRLGQGEQELIVRVHDATDQTRGKQSTNPSGIYYTPSSGIWQTVWIEPVPDVSIATIRITPNVDAGRVEIVTRSTHDGSGLQVSVSVKDGGSLVASAQGALGASVQIPIPSAKLWSPASPFLYDLEVSVANGDTVQSYFGMRKIDVADVGGVLRTRLNGNVIFMLGPLDQGFWPDGIYTAPTDEALRFDLETMKSLGLNMVRKHIKVEPERWYYHADRLGLVVWQDMPSYGGGQQFETELAAMITQHYNHPSIVVWIPFNEGWGQFDTVRIADSVAAQDPTRLVTPASGWNDAEAGDLQDKHCYSGPCSGDSTTRARVNGEFGGWGLATPGHQWSGQASLYNSVADKAALNKELVSGLQALGDLKNTQRLNAGVYTQLTDVETELNGLLTYDRVVSKVDPAVYKPAADALLAP